MPSETHVTGSGMRVPVTCGDRTYQLRPLTFGEAGQLAAAVPFAGGPAMVSELLRQALIRAGRDDDVAAVDAHEDADIALAAVLMSQPHPQEPPEAFGAWRERRERAQADLMRAAVKRARAEAFVADDPDLAAARSAETAAQHARRVKLLSLALGMSAEQVQALPAGDAATLVREAEALLAPGPVEGKA